MLPASASSNSCHKENKRLPSSWNFRSVPRRSFLDSVLYWDRDQKLFLSQLVLNFLSFRVLHPSWNAGFRLPQQSPALLSYQPPVPSNTGSGLHPQPGPDHVALLSPQTSLSWVSWHLTFLTAPLLFMFCFPYTAACL